MIFQAELVKVFNNYNIQLTEGQIEKFHTYYKLLLLWNKKFNLTAITTQSEVIVKHFLDSVLSVNQLPAEAKVIDIGTGAGFPGIPLKIMRDDIQLYLVDALQKRTVFLKEVVESLQLYDVMVVHERSEVLAYKEVYREAFDICVSRAVAPLNTLVEYSLPFVKVHGKVIAYKSKNAPEELTGALVAIKTLGGKIADNITIDIKETESVRHLVVINKTSKTPMQYPRKQNKPKTEPLS